MEGHVEGSSAFHGKLLVRVLLTTVSGLGESEVRPGHVDNSPGPGGCSEVAVARPTVRPMTRHAATRTHGNLTAENKHSRKSAQARCELKARARIKIPVLYCLCILCVCRRAAGLDALSSPSRRRRVFRFPRPVCLVCVCSCRRCRDRSCSQPVLHSRSLVSPLSTLLSL